MKHSSIIAAMLFLLLAIVSSMANAKGQSEIATSPIGPSGCSGADIELHHVFPKQFEGYFTKHGIDIDLNTIPLVRDEHRKLHHQNHYNRKWGEYIATRPESSVPEIYAFSSLLLWRAGIQTAIYCNYKTKIPTGKQADIEGGMREASKRLPPPTDEGIFSKKNQKVAKKVALNSTIAGSACGVLGSIGGAVAGTLFLTPGGGTLAGGAAGAAIAFAKCAAISAGVTFAYIYLDNWLSDPDSVNPAIEYFATGLIPGDSVEVAADGAVADENAEAVAVKAVDAVVGDDVKAAENPTNQ